MTGWALIHKITNKVACCDIFPTKKALIEHYSWGDINSIATKKKYKIGKVKIIVKK